tara:strand:+ start:1637 stop:1810 length:174 start_codon:yes stop_codon:yes gene_type:complete
MTDMKSNNRMTVARFLNYICYSAACPEGINPARWNGMLAWYRVEILSRNSGIVPEWD